ncbi:MAG: polymerase sigma factor [Paenibacillaceae bacterium]|nr:polymerase sigma factor [Paenibacillaceae bacterium]
MTEKELFETYKKDVYKTCLYMLQQKADAEDVCQDVFVSVFRHDWRQVEYLKTWLLRVTVNHCLNHLKKSSRYRTDGQIILFQRRQATAKAAEAVAEERESAMETVQLLGRLPAKIRAAVSLRYLQECSLNEISSILSIPEGTVKSRLNKGLKLLRPLMEARGIAMEKEGAHTYGQDGNKAYSVSK